MDTTPLSEIPVKSQHDHKVTLSIEGNLCEDVEDDSSEDEEDDSSDEFDRATNDIERIQSYITEDVNDDEELEIFSSESSNVVLSGDLASSTLLSMGDVPVSVKDRSHRGDSDSCSPPAVQRCEHDEKIKAARSGLSLIDIMAASVNAVENNESVPATAPFAPLTSSTSQVSYSAAVVPDGNTLQIHT